MSREPPVQFGIIGAGRIARNQFAPALSRAVNATLAAVASCDVERANVLHPQRAYDSYEALLDDGDVEAVYVATHNGLHHSLTLQALERGKHVICEKPLACSAAEAQEMVAAARQHGRHLVEAFMYRYHPQITRLQSLLAEGAVGEVTAVEASFSFRLTNMDDVRLRREWGGGSVFDVGCYCINAARLVLGGMPTAVKAMAAFHPRHDVDMSLHGVLDFGGGRFAVISCGFDGGPRNHLRVSGTGGTILLPEAFISWQNAPSLVLDRNGKPETFTFETVNVYQREIEDLSRAIRGGPPPMLGPEEGLRNAQVIDALLASARETARKRD